MLALSRVVKLTAAMVVISAALSCGCARQVTEAEAAELAHERFRAICRDFRIDPNSFGDPRMTRVPGFPLEFEWKPQANAGDGILVMVDSHGVTNTSFVPPDGALEQVER